MFDGVASRLLLGGALEEEFVDLAHRQALGQVVKGAVLSAAMVAVAIGFATPGEPFHQRGAQGVGRDFDLVKEEPFALAQGQRGFGCDEYLCHIYGEDMKTASEVNQKESGFKMRKCPRP